MTEPPAKAVFLSIPASDNGATGRRWPELARRAAALGLVGDVLFSEQPEHLRDLARQAAEDGATLVVAVGGDGTVNEVASGIVGRPGVELAVIPRGTGVDFVRTYGIPTRLEAAVEVALRGRTRGDRRRPRRLPLLGGRAGQAWFFNIAGVGMSGAVAKRTNESSKAFGGKASYLWATVAVFARWRNTEVRVSVDGESRTGRMHEVVVANGRYLGGGHADLPGGQPRRRSLRRAPDRRRHEARPRPDAAEDLPRHATFRTRRPSCCAARTVTVDSDRTAPGRARRRAARNDAGPVRARAAGARLRVPSTPQDAEARDALPGRRLRAGLSRAPGRRPAGSGRPAPGRRRLRELVEPALELGDATLERVEPPHSPGEIVHAVAQRVAGAEQPRAARELGEPLERLLAGLGEPADHVLLRLTGSRHGRTIDDRPAGARGYGRMITGEPPGVTAKIFSRVASGTRMQPFDTARPIDHGSLVPWMPIGPPCAQPVSTSENADTPSAAGPNGPVGSVVTIRWLT